MTSRTSSNSGPTNPELYKIAREKIGDETFTASQEDNDSAVGKAKKRARNQDRDPAIDPKFQNDE